MPGGSVAYSAYDKSKNAVRWRKTMCSAIDRVACRSIRNSPKELGKIDLSARSKVIEQLVICLFARGHALLLGCSQVWPRTLLISRVAETMSLRFSARIQIRRDLMPMDITGTDIRQELPVKARLRVRPRAASSQNIVLARMRSTGRPRKPRPRCSKACRSTASRWPAGHAFPSMRLSSVAATQNPIEQEGTYPRCREA